MTSNSTVLNDGLSPVLAVSGASICMVSGTLVNALAMIVILKRKPLKEHHMSPVLFFQSFFDLTFCLLCLPFVIIRFSTKEDLFKVFPNTEKVCEWSAFIFYTNIAICFWSKGIISLNRVFMIQGRNVKKHFSWGRTLTYYLLVVFIAIFMMSIPMSGKVWDHIRFTKHTFTCTIVSDDAKDENPYPSSKIFLSNLAFIIPTFVMVIGFGYVALKLKKLPISNDVERQINTVSLLIFATFVMLYGPCAFLPLDPLEDSKMPGLHVFFWILTWCGSVVYPFIYIGTSKFYRRQFCTFFGKTPENPSVNSLALAEY